MAYIFYSCIQFSVLIGHTPQSQLKGNVSLQSYTPQLLRPGRNFYHIEGHCRRPLTSCKPQRCLCSGPVQHSVAVLGQFGQQFWFSINIPAPLAKTDSNPGKKIESLELQSAIWTTVTSQLNLNWSWSETLKWVGSHHPTTPPHPTRNF